MVAILMLAALGYVGACGYHGVIEIRCSLSDQELAGILKGQAKNLAAGRVDEELP